MAEQTATKVEEEDAKETPKPASSTNKGKTRSSGEYDIVVIGSGPAGQRAAIQAAKLGKRVAVVERRAVVGGVCTNTGTIPSKTFREAVMHFSGFRERNLYGASYTVKADVTADDLLFRTNYVIRNDHETTRHQLGRNGIELIEGTASFVGSNTIHVRYTDGSGDREISTSNTIIAVGTKVNRSEAIPFDGKQIITSDDILNLDRIPRSMVVVGGGVVGTEYASIFSALGTRVTLIEKRDKLLTFVDEEIVDSFVYQLRQNRVHVNLGEEVEKVEHEKGAHGELVRLYLKSGKQVVAEKALFSIGRQGNTNRLNLDKVGIKPDDRGRIKVDSNYQTEIPGIYAVGDVIGFPSLASTSMEQGRMAACHAFGEETESIPELFPYGIYAVPEISMVGKTEADLTKEGIPYGVGKAYYKEISRGQIIGDQTGMLKLIFHLETHKLLGCHIIGEGATELIHIGQAVMAFDGPLEFFVNNVFNYPTLAECYKTAAFDGLNRMRG